MILWSTYFEIHKLYLKFDDDTSLVLWRQKIIHRWMFQKYCATCVWINPLQIQINIAGDKETYSLSQIYVFVNFQNKDIFRLNRLDNFWKGLNLLMFVLRVICRLQIGVLRIICRLQIDVLGIICMLCTIHSNMQIADTKTFDVGYFICHWSLFLLYRK